MNADIMNIEQIAQQLERAAQILRTRHPWQWLDCDGQWVQSTPDSNPAIEVALGNEIRLILATPPDGRPLHNPEGLTAEQVGAGWRLTVEGEWNPKQEYWHSTGKWTGSTHYSEIDTFRLPLSTPWPDPKPDPYAELKQAHKEGKVIEFIGEPAVGPIPIKPPFDNFLVEHLRIKPEPPPFQLPPPPPGMQWHREDGWTAEMLPQGYRPLVDGEVIEKDDETPGTTVGIWQKAHASLGESVNRSDYWYWRTSRPLTFTHLGQTWTYHRPGDPMPCDGERSIHMLRTDEGDLYSSHSTPARFAAWSDRTVRGWRYADEPKTRIPLGPEDVPPGSVIQLRDRPDSDALAAGFHDVICVCRTHVVAFNEYGNKITIEWAPLKDWKINRSLPLTGKWNPTAWEPCHKPG